MDIIKLLSLIYDKFEKLANIQDCDRIFPIFNLKLSFKFSLV
jgi:hypothetical protein